jgi:hypothetical protein
MEIIQWYDNISDKMQSSQLTHNRPLTVKYVFVICLPTQHIVYCSRSAAWDHEQVSSFVNAMAHPVVSYCFEAAFIIPTPF